jgi:membrane-bound lytic murein transglycosylase B
MKNKRFISLFLSIAMLTASVPGVTVAEVQNKEQLEAELRSIEEQIKIFEKELSQTRSEKGSLASKISQLKSEQSQINLQIKSSDLLINNLENQISATRSSIEVTEEKTKKLQDEIANTILNIHEKDRASLVVAVAGDGGIAGFFAEVEQYEQLSKHLSQSLNQMKELKKDYEEKVVDYDSKQEEAEKLIAVKLLQQNGVVERITEQNTLLAQTKGKEEQYAEVLKVSKQRAGQIRSQIYETIGTNRQVTFGEAMDMAIYASSQTGVRAALLLAILTQESNLGKNVGTCNRAGDPPEKGWQVVMKPTRDQEPFLVITGELGLDPNTTPISCPMKDSRGNQVGWGGAMGPAQFIPSTWMGYREKVSAITGKPANPWDIKDAFLASAIKLKAGGATQEGETGEWKAAMRYFSGSTNTRFRFYGDNVLKLARKYQADVDAIQGSQ